MNKLSRFLLLSVLVSGVVLPVIGQQKEKKKTTPDKKDEIVIRKKSEGDKVTIIVDGNDITVNGKPLAEYNGDDIIIRKRNIDALVAPYAFTAPKIALTVPRLYANPNMGWNYNYNYRYNNPPGAITITSNRAFLGVITEKTDGGVIIKEVMKESAAAKAGLKEGDIITKVGTEKIEDSDDLYEAIGDRKPGEEVEITFLRNKKESKLKIKLEERKVATTRSFNYRSPRVEGFGPMNDGYFYGWNRPRLGIRIQDTEDEKGVKVLEVEDESLAAKAGIKRDDIVTEIDGKSIKDADDAREALNDAREKSNYTLKLLRGGSPVTVDIKVPKNLKKADL